MEFSTARLCLLAAGLVLVPAASFAGELRVRVSGVEEEKGTVRVALFRSAEDYDADQRAAGHFTAASKRGIEAVFAGLPAGRYGVSCFHDVNGNEVLDKNAAGLPIEPFGFSRNARGHFGPPKFDDLAVEVGSGSVTLDIELH